MTTPSETVRTRVERLERASRRDRAIVLGIVVLALATAQAPAVPAGGPRVSSSPITVTNASGQSATLTATGLVLRDATHTARLFIGIDEQNRPSVDLHDKTGGLRESMYLFGDNASPTLRQFDTNNKRRLEMRLTDAGNGEVRLSDGSGRLRGAFFIGSTGNPQLGLYGSDEKLRAFLATDEVSPYLVMRDASGTNRVNVGGFSNGTIGMDIRDASNNVLWKAP